MNLSLPKFGRKSAVLTSTLLVIIGAFAYYFLGYVKANESRFIARAYRVLDRKAVNVVNKIESYKGNQEFKFAKVREEFSQLHAAITSEIRANNNTLQITIDEKISELELLNEKVGRSRSKEPFEKSSYTRFFSNAREQILQEIDELRKQLRDVRDVRIDSSKLNEFRQIVENQDLFEDPQLILEPVLQGDFFDEYIFLSESTDSAKSERSFDIFYQTFANKIDLKSISPFLQNSMEELQLSDRLLLDELYTSMGPKIIKPMDVTLFNEGYKLLFHRLDLEGESYYLGGFVKTSRFKTASRKVEVFFLVLSILIILLVIIAMPILKLIFMSPIERLHISNVVLVGASIVLGVPLILVIIFSLYDFVLDGNNQLRDRLELLSDKIEDQFTSEVEVILSDLHRFDTLITQSKRTSDLDFSNYPEFNHVFWINNEAYPTRQHTLLNIDTSQIWLGERDYYKKIVDEDMWTYNHSRLGPVRFYLQSIISWNDFSHEVAISIPSSTELPVSAMTSKLHSVIDPILPAGYGFAIIDEEGNVKFHSDGDRVLQENFLDETDNAADIRSAIFARIPASTNLKYRNLAHQAYIQPINAMPLFLVTFYSKEFRNAEIQGIITLSVILLFGSFSVVSLMILILYLIQKRRSKLRIKTFLFNWLKPNTDRALEHQILTILFSIILIVLLAMTLSSLSERDVLFTMIITNAYLFIISYTWLAPKNSRRYTDRSVDRTNFYWSFVLFIIAADFFYFFWIDKDSSVIILLYQIFLLSFVTISGSHEEVIKAIHKRIPKVRLLSKARRSLTKNAYNIFLFVWLLLSSGLPMFYIFMVSYNQEMRIWEKYKQLHLASSLQDKVTKVDKRAGDFKDEYQKHFFEGKLDAGIYLFENDTILADTTKQYDTRSGRSFSDLILFELRPGYNDLVIESKGLTFDQSDEGAYVWFYDYTDVDRQNFIFQNNYSPVKRPQYKKLYVSSNLDLLDVDHFLQPKGIILLLLVTFVFAVIYKTIDFCVSRIYGTEYRTFRNTLPLTMENFKKISIGDDSITHHKQRQILLLGLPKSNKSNLLQALEGKVMRIDMIQLDHKNSWEDIIPDGVKKYDAVILENFEYGVSSHKANIVRLQLLEYLSISSVSKIVVSSNIHPSAITDFYQTKLNSLPAGNPAVEEHRHSLETWRRILGGFIIVHNPIKENKKINSYLRGWVKQDSMKELFKVELNKGSFLPNLLPAIKDYYIKLKRNAGGNEELIDKEDIILRIQLLAESYYLSLWDSLTRKEKYIIYDLAKDRFVNVNNKHGIRSLLEKGLIVYENELRIMNESFTNFVLSIIKKTEALKMEKEARAKGNWSTISSVLGLMLLGILAFFFLGNPDFFSDFNALLGMIAAVIGVLPRISGMLNTGSSKIPPTNGS